MGRGYNESIKGVCVGTLRDNNMRLFRTITSHIVMNSPTGVGYSSGTFACGQNAFQPLAGMGTRIIPDMYVFPTGSIYRASYIYNQTTAPISLKTFDDEPVYFCEDDLIYWRKRPMYVPNTYRMYAQGPALQASHAWDRLQRRPNYANNYAGRKEYDFLDYSRVLQPTTTSTTTPEPPSPGSTTPPPEPPPCKIKDFLTFMHPATPLWTNVPEPFLGKKLFEDTGEKPPSVSYLGGKNFMPFCNPLPVRNSAGVVLGNYVGYSFCFIFGQNNIGFPVRPYLPDNPQSPVPPPNTPPVNPLFAFYSCEVLVYLASDSEALGSPCIGRKRFWMYSEAGQSGGYNWFQPYYAMYLGPMNGNWQFDVLFPYFNGGTETIQFNLSDCTVLMTA